MQFVCYSDWGELPSGVTALFERSAADSVFFSRAWFENLISTTLAGKQSLMLACVVDKNEVLAMLPLSCENDGYYSALTHLYSSLFSLLLAEHKQLQIVRCLVNGLESLGVVSLRLQPLAEDDSAVGLLQQVMESSGFDCYRRAKFYNWFYPVNGASYQDYIAARPARVRNTLARKQRKLEREQNYSIRLFQGQGIDKGIADYQAAYAKSWKANEQFDQFVEGLAHRLAACGWLRLAVLYMDDQPAAAQFWFVVQRRASIFKLVHDEAWKHYSPGTILISFLMRQVIDTDQVEEIDFLTGNDAYKQDWMSHRRQRWALHCVKKTVPVVKRNSLLEWSKRLFFAGHLK